MHSMMPSVSILKMCQRVGKDLERSSGLNEGISHNPPRENGQNHGTPVSITGVLFNLHTSNTSLEHYFQKQLRK